MNISEKLEDRKLERKIYYLFGTTAIFFFLFCVSFLLIPIEEEKIIFGTVEKKNYVKIILNQNEVNELSTWSYQNQKIEIEKIEERIYLKEDGNAYQILWILIELPEKQNHSGNLVSLKLLRKETKWNQIKKILRSVIN